MNAYKINLQWRMVSNLDHITEIIREGGHPSWPGLVSADQIISITWVEPLHGYTVVWKVREWEENNDAI